MNEEVKNKLKKILPTNKLHFELSDRYSYSFDASFGEYLPEGVAQPSSAQEISEIVKLANQYGFPLYPRGSATSLSGGPLPVEGGLVLDMSQMRDKLIIDKENMIAITSPGVLTSDIHNEAEKAGLFYPPDPSSAHVSTIAGNILENSSGPKGLKYGTTKEYVIGMEVVTPTGEIVRVGGKTVKNVTGFDLTRLITGSEGLLGIVTEATLRLIPKPKDRKTMMATFHNPVDCGRAITKILSKGILPAAMELMDNACIRAVEHFEPSGLPVNAGALLILEVDGHPLALQEEIEQSREICEEIGALTIKVAESEKERNDIWTARKKVSPAITQLGPTKISEDATVPRSKIPEMMEKLNDIRDRYQLNLVVFGHAGDGNLHPNIITDKTNIEEMKRVEDAVGDIFQAALELGGTLSGEHGIGTLKAPYLEREYGKEGVALLKSIKHAWDPNNILNPGKMFAKEGQTKVVLT
ncbi:FAD-binding oxidoreductase [Thalassorhabdus alkalitolerans]|uniref:FAD-binding oxidoreductase n=1 Tax=Thalassorhabdus alkalitolerans TaxID=2282697 RepID=A0ABW0YPE7_9BACI